MTHTYLQNEIQYTVEYKKRKSLGIYIDLYGNIELRVPRETTDDAIIKLLELKWHWILEKQSEMKQRTQGYTPKTYEEGETFYFLGKKYPINLECICDSDENRLNFTGDQYQLFLKRDLIEDELQRKEAIQQFLKRFYYKECKRNVEKIIKEIQPMISVKPVKISISDDKSKWGSCDSRRHLMFNWKLAMAPVETMRYVVIHEMCHLEHLNHDRSFWRLVGKMMPNFEDHQQWLQNRAWKMVI